MRPTRQKTVQRRSGPAFLHQKTAGGKWAHHPVIVAFVDELRRARERGEIPGEVDAFHNAVWFLVGLCALLITMPESDEIRAPFVDRYLTTSRYGLRAV